MRQVKFSQGFSPACEREIQPDYIGPVRSFDELCQAFSLVHDRYAQLGYIEPKASGMRFGLLNLLPAAITFIAKSSNACLATVTVVSNSPAGLPSEREFLREYELLRVRRRKVAEATMFACVADPAVFGAVFGILALGLMQLVLKWCATEGIDDLCAVVNPKHVGFYTSTLGFKCLSAERAMPAVNGAPGVLLCLAVKNALSGISEPPSKMPQNIARYFQGKSFANPFASPVYRLLETDVAFLLSLEPSVLPGTDYMQWYMLKHYYPRIVDLLFYKTHAPTNSAEEAKKQWLT